MLIIVESESCALGEHFLQTAHVDTSRWRQTDQELKRHGHRFNRNPVPAL